MRDAPETINEIFMKSVEQYNSSRAFCHKINGCWTDVSHAEALKRVRAIALGLNALGVRKSEPVLLLSENRLEWILADLGTLLCGAVDVPLYHNSSTAQVEYIARDCMARVAFVSDAAQMEKLNAVRSKLPQLEKVITFTAPPSDDAAMLTLAELERRGEEVSRRDPALFDSLWQGRTAGDMATIIYTSGTTGMPKGVMLTHGNIATNVIATSKALGLAHSREIALSYLPFAHIFERNNLYDYLYSGASLYLAESLNTVAANLIEVRPTVLANVPRTFEKIYNGIVVTAASGSRARASLIHWCIAVGLRYAELTHRGAPVSLGLRAGYRLAYRVLFRRLHSRLGGRLRYLVSGGAPLSVDIAFLFLAARLPILQGYGLTETSPVICVNSPATNRIGTVGKPVSGVQVRIADDGEILARGPGITSGYFHREAETRAAFVDGWFRTGDLGHLDPDGYLVVTDRKKDLIKTSGGKYVAPLHVEGLILSSRFVSQVVVIGSGRRFPSALIVPNAEMIRSYAARKGIAAPDYSTLLKHPQIVDLIERQVDKYTQELPHYEKIKRIALIEREFSTEGGELTLTQKLRRQAVESKYKDVIEAIYEEEGSRIGEPDGTKTMEKTRLSP